VHLEGFAVAVRDAQGDLALLEGVQGELERGEWKLAVARARVGQAPGEVLVVEELTASGHLVGRAPTVRRAAARHGRLTLAAEANEGDDEALARGRTPSRIMALRKRDPGRAAAGSGGREQASARSRLFEAGGEVAMSSFDVVGASADGQHEILKDLAVRLSASEADRARLRIQGKGSGPGEGRVTFDVQWTPGTASVQGEVALDRVSLALFAPALPPLPFFELDRATVSTTLELSAEGADRVSARGELEIRELSFASEGLAKTPVGPIEIAASGVGQWTPARREVALAEGVVRIAGMAVTVEGRAGWPHGGYGVDVSATLGRTPCGNVLRAVPNGLLEELSSLEVEGTLAAKVRIHLDSQNLPATEVDFDIDDRCRFVAVPPLLDVLRFQQPFVHRVLEPDGKIFEMETGPGTAAWTPIELVSPFFVQAVIAHEDGRFFTHRGFAEPEIGVALARNLQARAFKFGASTITMQLVKNLFLHREKLLARKVQEALITWWLEQQIDKRRILELYLNVIEYGPEVYGIRNAALHYFGTIPMNLTPAQSAFLASILPSPKPSHAHYEKGELSAGMKKRMAKFLRHMRARERIDEEALSYGLAELESFRFYRPDQPPPPPPLIRGSAQPLPFDLPSVPSVGDWDTYEPTEVDAEDGSYGD
jgi:hypothetical protein